MNVVTADRKSSRPRSAPNPFRPLFWGALVVQICAFGWLVASVAMLLGWAQFAAAAMLTAGATYLLTWIKERELIEAHGPISLHSVPKTSTDDDDWEAGSN